MINAEFQPGAPAPRLTEELSTESTIEVATPSDDLRNKFTTKEVREGSRLVLAYVMEGYRKFITRYEMAAFVLTLCGLAAVISVLVALAPVCIYLSMSVMVFVLGNGKFLKMGIPKELENPKASEQDE
jgi:hypothetical protein